MCTIEEDSICHKNIPLIDEDHDIDGKIAGFGAKESIKVHNINIGIGRCLFTMLPESTEHEVGGIVSGDRCEHVCRNITGRSNR
jgi:hypothetical protein